jgi:hypothetical protein
MGIQPDTERMPELTNPPDQFIRKMHGPRILQSAATDRVHPVTLIRSQLLGPAGRVGRLRAGQGEVAEWLHLDERKIRGRTDQGVMSGSSPSTELPILTASGLRFTTRVDACNTSGVRRTSSS